MSRSERRERLRLRLVGGAFTALLAVQTATPKVADAAVRPVANDGSDAATLRARVDDLRAAQAELKTSGPDANGSLQWGNLWFKWGNGWHKWFNHWNNWHNLWNNWQNWNNWANWGNF
jgi:hypothetical protein